MCKPRSSWKSPSRPSPPVSINADKRNILSQALETCCNTLASRPRSPNCLCFMLACCTLCLCCLLAVGAEATNIPSKLDNFDYSNISANPILTNNTSHFIEKVLLRLNATSSFNNFTGHTSNSLLKRNDSESTESYNSELPAKYELLASNLNVDLRKVSSSYY